MEKTVRRMSMINWNRHFSVYEKFVLPTLRERLINCVYKEVDVPKEPCGIQETGQRWRLALLV